MQMQGMDAESEITFRAIVPLEILYRLSSFGREGVRKNTLHSS